MYVSFHFTQNSDAKLLKIVPIILVECGLHGYVTCCFVIYLAFPCPLSLEGKKNVIIFLIIKITISSIVIGLKNSYYPLIHLPSCYRTVCYRTACYRTVCYRTVQQTNHIQSCSLNQPITTLVSITIGTVYKLLNCQVFNVNFPVVT